MSGHKITDAQFDALADLARYPEIWWHDLPAGARDVLRRLGWLREARRVACATRDHKHPGYVTISKRGLVAFLNERHRRNPMDEPRFGNTLFASAAHARRNEA